MSPEKAHVEETERIQANWQIGKSSEQNVIKGCSTVLGNHREKDKEGLEKYQVYANFPTNILWVFALRHNSVTTYIKGL